MSIRRCMVVGSPIGHSRSPVIHRLFAEQTGLALRYEKREVRPGTLGTALTDLRSEGCIGVNVTIPLKEEAFELSTVRAPRAAAAGSANTLWFDASGAIHADNTDGVGLVRDLRANGMEPTGASVLLIGAGGAAMGILPSLMAEAPRRVTLMNRGLARAEGLATTYGVPVLALDADVDQSFDLVINSSALGLDGATTVPLSRTLLDASTQCYDIVYSRDETAFLRWAGAIGVTRRRDGLGMLVEQAAEAFFLWHGLKVATRPVIDFLRARL